MTLIHKMDWREHKLAQKYQPTVAAIADGEDLDIGEVERICFAAGKSAADFKADVAEVQRQHRVAELRQLLAHERETARDIEADLRAIDAAIVEPLRLLLKSRAERREPLQCSPRNESRPWSEPRMSSP